MRRDKQRPNINLYYRQAGKGFLREKIRENIISFGRIFVHAPFQNHRHNLMVMAQYFLQLLIILVICRVFLIWWIPPDTGVAENEVLYSFQTQWLFIIGTFIGGSLFVIIFKYVYKLIQWDKKRISQPPFVLKDLLWHIGKGLNRSHRVPRGLFQKLSEQSHNHQRPGPSFDN